MGHYASENRRPTKRQSVFDSRLYRVKILALDFARSESVGRVYYISRSKEHVRVRSRRNEPSSRRRPARDSYLKRIRARMIFNAFETIRLRRFPSHTYRGTNYYIKIVVWISLNLKMSIFRSKVVSIETVCHRRVPLRHRDSNFAARIVNL